MVTPVETHCFLQLSALNDASDEARRWLDAPHPAPDDTGRDAMAYYAAWLRITLLDLAMFEDHVVLTHEGVAEVLGIPDVALVAVLLDRLRHGDRERPPLTEADFARIAKSN
jgi:hypothetical protein